MVDTPEPEPEHAAIEADFSDYYERTLSATRTAEVDAHLAGCARCRTEYDRFRDAMGALSGLKRVAAPAELEKQVAETINRRSAGRFFGRRAFGDRIPFELVAVVGLTLLLILYMLVRWSTMGSVHDTLRRKTAPPASSEAKRVMPTP